MPTHTTVKSSKENNIYACEKHNHVIVFKYGKAADFKHNLQSSNIYKHLQTRDLINSKVHKEAGVLCIDQLFSKKMLLNCFLTRRMTLSKHLLLRHHGSGSQIGHVIVTADHVIKI